MRERLRILLAGFFYYSGLLHLALWRQRRSGQKLIILNYHRAQGNLAAQLRYLKKQYQIVSLEKALSAMADQSGTIFAKGRRLPVVVTFDDGYLDNYTYAFPLIQQLQIPVTIYIPPGYIESGACFWWLAPERLVQNATVEKVVLEGQIYSLQQPAERWQLIQAIDRTLRNAPSVAERDRRLTLMKEALGSTLPGRDELTVPDEALPMSLEQMREMDASGLVTFGAHTMYHPVLAALTEEAEVRYEISESRSRLEVMLGHPVHTFAYPIGRRQHLSSYSVQVVRDAGFTSAVTTLEECVYPSTDLYLLGRLPGDERLHWLVMAAELVGLLGIVSRLKKAGRKLLQR